MSDQGRADPTLDQIAEARLPSVRVYFDDLQRFKLAAKQSGMSFSVFARLALERAADNPQPLIDQHRELMTEQYLARLRHRH